MDAPGIVYVPNKILKKLVLPKNRWLKFLQFVPEFLSYLKSRMYEEKL